MMQRRFRADVNNNVGNAVVSDLQPRNVNTPYCVMVTLGVSSPGKFATLYEAVGGDEFFFRLTREFYAGVKNDPLLAPMYPNADFENAERRLRLFLIQYWGGPTTYSDERGHPRLRMRHNPFHIDDPARERWLHHMRAAIDTTDVEPAIDARLWEYFQAAASAMVNVPDIEEKEGTTPSGSHDTSQ